MGWNPRICKFVHVQSYTAADVIDKICSLVHVLIEFYIYIYSTELSVMCIRCIGVFVQVLLTGALYYLHFWQLSKGQVSRGQILKIYPVCLKIALQIVIMSCLTCHILFHDKCPTSKRNAAGILLPVCCVLIVCIDTQNSFATVEYLSLCGHCWANLCSCICVNDMPTQAWPN